MKACPQCNAQLKDDLLFCTKCGTKLSSEPLTTQDNTEDLFQEMKCPSCEIIFTDGSLFCNKCGTKLEDVPRQQPDPVLLYKQCPGCEKKFEDESLFCNMCGIKLVEVYDGDLVSDSSIMYCPACETEYSDDSLFCTVCGKRLEVFQKKSSDSDQSSGLPQGNFDNYSYQCRVCGCSITEGQERCSRCNTLLYPTNIVKIKI